MKIGITTPRGNVGSKIVNRLINDNRNEVYLLDHNCEKSYEAYGRNASVIECDLSSAESLVTATKGLDMIYFVSPPDNGSDTYLQNSINFGKNFASAVNTNDIKHVVFQSSYGAHLPYGTGPIVGLFHIEQELNRTAANVVHLRACYFMENFLWFKNPISAHGVIPLPVLKESQSIYNSTDDIAENAVKWLASNEWSGKIIDEIHGEKLTFEEIASLLSKQTGNDVSIAELSDEDSVSAYTQPHIGFSHHYAELFNELHRGIDTGLLTTQYRGPERSNLKTSFEDFVDSNF